jgi:phosphoribosylglycinamide formyltransferase 1
LTTIALFASGSGSNAENIVSHFSTRPAIRFVVLCNKPGAGVLDRAARLQVPSWVFDRSDFYESGRVLDFLRSHQVDFIVLAGFLWLVPASLVQAYPQKIINIHPALLPKFGGKGMYGDRVHRAVLAAGEPESGITIHYVNEHYDEGQVIVQARCPVLPQDTPDTLAARIHALEYAHYPQVVEKMIGQ